MIFAQIIQRGEASRLLDVGNLLVTNYKMADL